MAQVVEIKQLNGAIGTVQAQLNKYKEKLVECERYKAFLDSLTPAEWQQNTIQGTGIRLWSWPKKEKKKSRWLMNDE